MGGGSPGVSLPDLGGIWFAVSASFPGRLVNHDGRVHRLGALLALWCCFFSWLVLSIVWAISRPLCRSVWILGAVMAWRCQRWAGVLLHSLVG